MAAVLEQFRAQYPQYKDVPDGKLASAIRKKYYADMPPDQFYRKAGLEHLVGITAPDNPTDGMSGTQKFLAGVGKSFNDTGLGVRQLVGSASQQEVDERRRMDAPLMNTGAGIAGNISGAVAQSIVPGGAIAKGARLLPMAGRAAPYLAAAAEGAAFNGVQPVASGESRGGNAALGAAFGAGGQAVVGGAARAAHGLSGNAGLRRVAQQGRRLGVDMLPHQLIASPTYQTVQSALNKLPLSGAGRAAQRQTGDFNEALGAHLGVRTRALDDVAFDDAMTSAGQTFDDLSARNALDINHAIAPLSQIEQEVAQYGTEAQQRAVKSAIDELMNGSQGGQVNGTRYKELRSRWSRLSKGGGETANWLNQVREAVEGAMDRSISPQDAAAWKAVRSKYRDLKTVEPLVSDGGISPRALMGRVKGDKAGKAQMARGRRGPLGDFAKLGQRIADKSPDSGTALRSLVYNGGLPLLGAAGASSDNPYAKGVGYGILGMLAGGVAGRAGNSSRLARWMAEGSPTLQGLARSAPGRLAGRNLPRLASAFPVVANAQSDGGLELDIVGGTPGPAISQEELDALRRQSYGY